MSSFFHRFHVKYQRLLRRLYLLDRGMMVREAKLDEYLRDNLFQNPRYKDSGRLNRYERKVFSQTGEDGILEEIFARIGEGQRQFVEFGVEAHENNSIYLMVRGWQGFWLEGDKGRRNTIVSLFKDKIDEGRLKVQQAFVTPETIEPLFRSMGVEVEVDLLSIDIDGNDFHVWNALETFRPRVVAIEYNPIFPPHVDWVMKYDPAHRWDGSSHFGASLKALERLGREKGYSLVACSFAGTNAFFVRSDLVGDKFEGPFTAEHMYEPSRLFLIWFSGGHPRRYGPGIVRS